MINSSNILHGKILIVDDLESSVLLLDGLLRRIGYVAISSTMHPEEVRELHLKNSYDLILLDLEMPGMDGFQVMEELTKVETNGYLPILVITAHQEYKLRALQAGAKDFISKPFDLIEVQTRIHNMLEVRLLYKQLEHYNEELEFLALHDALTRLPNRRLLMDRLELSIAFARRNKRTMAVMYLDLDGFKQLNDTMGHDAGDTLLSMAAGRMMAAVRQEDTVARLGGDEFVIVLAELSDDEGADTLATKVIRAVSQPYSIQGRDVGMTVSIGVAIYPAHGENAETLMKSADTALYEAKRAGKNGYRIAVLPPVGGGAA